ncbi:sigma-70 family RNA polymerase sigma factor [bacterium]|nr:sigma-70 family RNA polymerase sigma factor [bacterium]
MPFARVRSLLWDALPGRWVRRGRNRGTRLRLRLEPLEDRALLTTLTVTVTDTATLPSDIRIVWIRELESGRYDSVTITSLDRAGLDRLLDALRWPAPVVIGPPPVVSPPVPPASSVPPPPASPPPATSPGQPPSPEPADPAPGRVTLAPAGPAGGWTLVLFKPAPSTSPAEEAQPVPTRDVAPAVTPTRGGTDHPAAPPERSFVPEPSDRPLAPPRRDAQGGVPPPENRSRAAHPPPIGRADGLRPTTGDHDSAAGTGRRGFRPPPPDPGGRSAPEPEPGLRPDAGTPADGTLLRRFAAGDQPAFAELVRRHETSVLSVCTRVLGDSDQARDAAQAAFLTLARRAAGLDVSRPLAGWLYRVAYRMALRVRRAAARRWRAEQIAVGRRREDVAGPDHSLEQADLFRALREELDRLPDKYRVPLTLCYLDGLTHDEVARAAGLPRGSVAKRLGEGLDRLRERLAGRGILL